MKTVYKYDAPIADAFALSMPAGAEVLCVQVQGGEPKLWALVDSNAESGLRHFHWRGTGHVADGLGRYVGTVQGMSGMLVFHLFEAV